MFEVAGAIALSILIIFVEPPQVEPSFDTTQCAAAVVADGDGNPISDPCTQPEKEAGPMPIGRE